MEPTSSLARKGLSGFAPMVVCFTAFFAVVTPAWSQGQSEVPLPAGTERATVDSVCTACHTTERIASSARSSEEWEQVVQRMIRNGADLPNNKIDPVVGYLSTSFPPAPGGAAPRTADGKPDLSGTWIVVNRSGGNQRSIGELNLTDWGLDHYRWNSEPTTSLRLAPGLSNTGSDETYEAAVQEVAAGRRDQDPWYNCYPAGLVRLGPPSSKNGGGPGVEIIQTPGVITLVYESRNAIRYIYTDGREHPTPLELTWNGHSIGTWDGDTLVVDTVGLRDESWLDAVGHEHSSELHVVERIRRVDAATLEFERTLTDPIAFEGTFTDSAVLKLNPRYLWKQNQDDDCTQYMIRKPGFGEGLGGLLGIGEPPGVTTQ